MIMGSVLVIIGLFLVEAILQTLTLHVEDPLETRKPLVCLIKNAF